MFEEPLLIGFYTLLCPFSSSFQICCPTSTNLTKVSTSSVTTWMNNENAMQDVLQWSNRRRNNVSKWRSRVQRENVIMWLWYVNGFNFSTKYEMCTILRINRNWTCGSHLLLPHILRRDLEFFVILTEQLQKNTFPDMHSFTSHDASKINPIPAKYFKIKIFWLNTFKCLAVKIPAK